MMLRKELYKIFIKNKLLAIIVIGIIVQGIMWCRLGEVPKFQNYETQKFYEEYVSAFEGKVTDETREKIKDDYFEGLNVQANSSKLLDKLLNGKISEEEYKEQIKKYDDDSKDLSALGTLYSEYVTGKKEYALLKNAWENFFTSMDIELVTFLMVVMVALVTVRCEKESSMELYNLTSKKGREKLAMVKILMVMGFCVAVSAIMYLLKFEIMAMKFGTTGWNFPLCSIDCFSTARIDVSIIQGFVLFFFIKTAGWVYIGIMAMVVASLFKSVATVGTGIICVVILPAYFALKINGDEEIYKFPLANGLLKARGYVMGDYVNNDEILQSNFKMLSKKAVMAVAIVDVVIFAICLEIVFFKLSGKRVRFKNFRKKAVVLTTMALAFSLTGCGNNSESFEKSFDSDYVKVLDYIYDKSENKVVNTKISPFDKRTTLELYGDDVVIIDQNATDEAINCNVYSVMNLKTYEEKVVYTQGNAYDFTGLMDIETIYPNIQSIFFSDISGEQSLYIEDDKMFFVQKDRVDVVDLGTKKLKSVMENYEGENLSCYGNKIYYTNERRYLCAYDVTCDKTEVVIQRPMTKYYVFGDGVLWKSYLGKDSYAWFYTDENGDVEISQAGDVVAFETGNGFVASNFISAYVFDKTTRSVKTLELEMIFGADNDGVYGLDYEAENSQGEQVVQIIMYDYNGNEVARCDTN